MKHNFKLKLSATMMLFALVISITLAIANYVNLKTEAIDNEQRIIEEKLKLLHYALDTSERANLHIGNNISEHLLSITTQLQTLYKDSPQLQLWDYNHLSQQYEIDLYIINEQNEIIHSNVSKDIGLNFYDCCRKLAEILDERRADGRFYIDGFDVEQATGDIKSYSYMGTPDKQYIIQLGFSWLEDPLFNYFNFLNSIDQLKASSDVILDVNILNLGGLAYGKSEAEFQLNKQARAAFEHTLTTGEDSSYDGLWNDEPATFLYTQYISEQDSGTSQSKVVELIYSKSILNGKLNHYKESFILSIFIILFVTVILSLIISRWVAKPLYMAFHDRLTSLGNRAFFEEYVNKRYITTGEAFTFMMIDMDNFKQVNDTYGHNIGDKLLQHTARLLEEAAIDGELVFRLGGDEFIIVMPAHDQIRAEELADYLLSTFQQQISPQYAIEPPLSLSIGISHSISRAHDIESLLRSADQALYTSKKLGKNTYSC